MCIWTFDLEFTYLKIEKLSDLIFIGIPSTLNYIPIDISVRNGLKSPALIPYPDLKHNELGNCANGLNTVYRIKVDSCDRLWVLDTGTYGYENTSVNLCPYAINVFDLNTNRKLRRYIFKQEDTNSNTFIANIAVDIGQSCEDTFAYFSDELGYGLIVYSWEQNDSWRFTHNYFLPDPLAGNFHIGGLNFQWGFEGIFGMSLSSINKHDGFRSLYFHPLASNHEFVVSTRTLRNQSKVADSFYDFTALTSRGPNSRITTSVIDNDGVMFFNLIDQNAIGCWNSLNEYHPNYQAVIDSDHIGLIFPSDIKVVGQNVWVLSDRMPIFLESTLNSTDINFRVYYASRQSLIANTVCEKQLATTQLHSNLSICDPLSLEPNYELCVNLF